MFTKKWFLYSRIFDSIFFFAPFIITFLFVEISERFFPDFLYPSITPLWLFIFAIVFDVGHVWGSIFRTYLRKEILVKQKKLLIGTPIFSVIFLYILGNINSNGHEPYFVLLSTLAYIAVFHFIKQQIGFVMLYEKIEEIPKKVKYFAAISDKMITWVITGFPFLYWITHYDSMEINWFISGEFSFLADSIPRLDTMWILYGILLIFYSISQLILIIFGSKMNPMKYLYIIGTAYIWYSGIVAHDSIIIFGFGNMLLHGLNYYGIVIGSSMTERGSYTGIMKKIMKNNWIVISIFIFISLFFISTMEEFLWDQFVWKERSVIFSDIFYNTFSNPYIITGIVSILGSIQLTHYIIDRYIWRKDFGEIYTNL